MAQSIDEILRDYWQGSDAMSRQLDNMGPPELPGVRRGRAMTRADQQKADDAYQNRFKDNPALRGLPGDPELHQGAQGPAQLPGGQPPPPLPTRKPQPPAQARQLYGAAPTQQELEMMQRLGPPPVGPNGEIPEGMPYGQPMPMQPMTPNQWRGGSTSGMPPSQPNIPPPPPSQGSPFPGRRIDIGNQGGNFMSLLRAAGYRI